VGLSLSTNGQTFPFNGVFMGLIVVVYTMVMSINPDRELKMGFVMIFMFFLNVLMIVRFKGLIKQVVKYAHVFVGKNHYGIKEKLIKAIDKELLLNNLAFIVIILMPLYLYDLPVNKINIVISLFMSVVFFINTYTIALAVKIDTKVEFILIDSIIYAVLFLILQALIDKYEASFFDWTVNLIVLAVAMLVRYFAEQRFMKAKFENLIK
jgi:hypothetical protein